MERDFITVAGLQFLAHLIHFSGRGFLLDNITATLTHHTQTHLCTHTGNANTATVTQCSELSVRTDVAPIIESERDGAVVLPLEHTLSTEHQ